MGRLQRRGIMGVRETPYGCVAPNCRCAPERSCCLGRDAAPAPERGKHTPPKCFSPNSPPHAERTCMTWPAPLLGGEPFGSAREACDEPIHAHRGPHHASQGRGPQHY
jgi:hypothetical protein